MNDLKLMRLLEKHGYDTTIENVNILKNNLIESISNILSEDNKYTPAEVAEFRRASAYIRKNLKIAYGNLRMYDAESAYETNGIGITDGIWIENPGDGIATAYHDIILVYAPKNSTEKAKYKLVYTEDEDHYEFKYGTLPELVSYLNNKGPHVKKLSKEETLKAQEIKDACRASIDKKLDSLKRKYDDILDIRNDYYGVKVYYKYQSEGSVYYREMGYFNIYQYFYYYEGASREDFLNPSFVRKVNMKVNKDFKSIREIADGIKNNHHYVYCPILNRFMNYFYRLESEDTNVKTFNSSYYDIYIPSRLNILNVCVTPSKSYSSVTLYIRVSQIKGEYARIYEKREFDHNDLEEFKLVTEKLKTYIKNEYKRRTKLDDIHKDLLKILNNNKNKEQE